MARSPMVRHRAVQSFQFFACASNSAAGCVITAVLKSIIARVSVVGS